MDIKTYIKKNQKITERVSLIINSFCAIVMSAIAFLQDWNTLTIQVFITTMAICWVYYIKKYRNYKFRAYLTACMAWVNFIVYGINTTDLKGMLPVMCSRTVLLGIYCMPKIVYVSIASSAFLVVYHSLVLFDIHAYSLEDNLKFFMQIIGVFTTAFILHYLIKSQNSNHEQLIETIDSLKKVEKSKDDFLANVSHEIRTPINTVCGMSEMILREEISDRVRLDVFDIQTAGRNLLAAVSDVLDFSELESGKMEILEEPYNITSTINDIINMSIARKNNKAVELIVDCDANIPCGLVGDEQKIRRLIMNIVDNAIKFTNEGGVIIKVSYRKEKYGINLVISVKDTGIGMKDETIEKLFTSFNQVDTRRNRQEGGIGLGLAISQAIVTKMGGFITVKSKYEKGSMVQMVIPQKVSDDRPIVNVEKNKDLYIAFYVDMEKYDYVTVREGYESSIHHMMEQLDIAYKTCKNLQELKRRVEKEKFTHIFISWDEYCEDQQYFEELSYRRKVVMIRGRDNEEMASGEIQYIYKPFYVLSVASVLNGDAMLQNKGGRHLLGERFIAPNASVLVVDDNVMNLRVVEGLLKPYKIKVFVAGSGKEAIQKVQTMEFDFIFMDHMMPEMDGVETLHHIRQKPGRYFKTVPIIALTANAIGGAREMFLAEGFSDFVSKPIEVSVLERVLRKHIPESKIIKLNKENEKLIKRDEDVEVIAEMNTAEIKKYETSRHETSRHETSRHEASRHEVSGYEKSRYEKSGYETSEYVGSRIQASGYEGLGMESKKTNSKISMEGINVEKGIMYSGGDINDYIDIVRIYYTSGLEKKKEIEKAFDEKDWNNYTILTHSLKSMSMSIGAETLSEMAKGLEAASKKEDEPYIYLHHEETLAEYEDILSVISNNTVIYPKENQMSDENIKEEEYVSDKFEIFKEELCIELNVLKEQLETFEFEGVQTALGRLFEYQYAGTKLEELLATVKDKADSFDFMSACEELETVMAKMG